MPTFTYVAINEQGREITGAVEAADSAAVEKILEDQSLLPVRVEQGGVAKSKPAATFGMRTKKRKRRRITDRDIIDFSRQLVTLLKAGVPIPVSYTHLTLPTN